MNIKEEHTISLLLKENVIPENGIFQISENILNSYIEKYNNIFSKSNNALKKKSNHRFSRRLAGLSFLKLNFERGARFHQMKSGLIYMIENEIFPDHFKLGMTIDLNSRLNSYQTYDPFRRFKVYKYEFVLDRILSEKKILNHPDIMNEQGEWIKKENAKEIFEKIIFYK